MDLSSVDFVDLLERLGMRNARMTAGGVEVSYSCHRPEHSHGDDSPSAYVNSETGALFCHGCKMRGTVTDLVMDVQQVPKIVAERWLRDTYGMEMGTPIGGSLAAEIAARLRPPAPLPAIVRPPESWLSSVRLDWRTDDPEPHQRYMLDRGLSRATIEEYDVGFDYLSDRITIPVRALDGSLFGVKGRDWQGSHPARYLVLGDRPGGRHRYGFDTYEVSEVVFGLHRNRRIRQVVVVEGELDSMALAQMGVPRAVATNTARLSERQARLIVDEAEEVVLYYDAGIAGQEGVEAAVARLDPYVRVRVVDPLDVDPCDALRFGAQADVLRAIDQARSPLARGLGARGILR